VWNASSRIQGQADPALSEEGWVQCQRLGERMRDATLSRIYTSDLERARRTAEAVAGDRPAPILDARLREVDLGEWEGATSAGLEQDYPELFKAWLESPSWDLVPGGEGEDAFESRVFAAMTDILGDAAADDTVAVVTHIGVIRLLLTAIAGTQRENMRWRWAIHNTSLCSIDGRPDFGAWRAGDVEVVAINDSAHLKMVPA
jgi:broad specificity phosphatase PhoE